MLKLSFKILTLFIIKILLETLFSVIMVKYNLKLEKLQIINSLLFLSIMIYLDRKYIKEKLNLSKCNFKELGFYFVSYYLFWLGLLGLFVKMNLLKIDQNINESIGINFIIIVLLGPIIEEYLYRGIIIDKFSNKNSSLFCLKNLILVALTSTLFSIFHYQFNPNFFIHFSFSCFACFLYLKNRNLLQVMTFHIVTNFIGYFGLKEKISLGFDNFYISVLFIVLSILLFLMFFKVPIFKKLKQ